MSIIDGIRLNLLLFSVGGVHFGMDAEVAAAIAEYQGEEAEDLFWFHEEIGYGGAMPVYSTPTIVTIRGEDSQSYRVIIDKMEDIAEISSVDIQPLPLLVEPLALRKGMWGVTVREGHMVLLMDFTRLLRHKPGTAYI
ncbi:MAG: hypothetical protein ACYDG4_12285 [Desulfuromonadaceae bacterium]